MAKKHKKLTGKILIAQPFMDDNNFKRSVVGITEHREDGTVGFILNKPVKLELSELVAQIKTDEKFKLYYGGPVATDTIHYIHDKGDLLDDSVEVAKGIFWGGSFEKLIFLIESGLIHRHHIRFYIGYSGWSEGQLQDEMDAGSWICLLYTSPSPRDATLSRMPSSA